MGADTPNPGGRKEEINQAGLDYYSKLVDMLLENGIEPFVTIFHWDTPTALDEAYGSWRDADNMVADFTRYAEVLFQTLGDRVKCWMTINEVSSHVAASVHLREAVSKD